MCAHVCAGKKKCSLIQFRKKRERAGFWGRTFDTIITRSYPTLHLFGSECERQCVAHIEIGRSER